MDRLANFEKEAKSKPARSSTSYKPPPSLPKLLGTTTNAVTTPTGPPGGPGGRGGLTGEISSIPPGRGTKTVSRTLSEKVAAGGRSVKEGSVASKIQLALSKRSQSTALSAAGGGAASTNVTTSTVTSSKLTEVGIGPRHVISSGGGRVRGGDGSDPQSLVEMMTGANPLGGGIHNVLKKNILMSESSSNESSDSDSERELSIVQHEATPKGKGAGTGKKGGGHQKTSKPESTTEGKCMYVYMIVRLVYVQCTCTLYSTCHCFYPYHLS